MRTYLERLETIRADAEADGLRSLEYLITMAKLEAERLVEERRDERHRWDAQTHPKRQMTLEGA
ncbi:hypothetical protein [Enterovirga aerilata]|uniref:Uncharacterized protein n=1 Tax=Enterovirga aerilata TaxID=2730920 RepID=A0A849ICS1_9HYPH|nr:hypothetical protein [Enterovirga sp. DB1703]NNM74219.1 hypothetical protein [Enterovirga sp. DB1703]